MTALLDDLAAVRSKVVEGMRAASVHRLSDTELVDAIARAADAVRVLEGVLADAVGEVAHRSRSLARDERLTARTGCRSVNELVQRLTRCSPQTAAKLEKAAKATAPRWDPITDEARPALLPAIGDALRDGEVGIDGVLAVADPLLEMGDRAARQHLLAADELLAASARGTGADAAPPACADLLRVQAQVWAVALDPDGAEPADRDSDHRRDLKLGVVRDGVVPIRGLLVPEVAAQLQRIFDAVLLPYTDGPAGVRFTETDADPHEAKLLDERTRGQKQHDALASALFAAASSSSLPKIGGAAPTLVVTARAEDLARGSGWAFLEGCDQPVPLQAATRVGCAGVIQRLVLGDDGSIVRLGTEERVFNRHQRRAIAARDGGCIIPGCGVPAAWCEIHHSTGHAVGGPTHTDNGVLLCWWHHHTIDTGPWRIRITDGIPEVLAPTWFDRHQRWRPVTKSKVRMLDLTVRRT